jgi:hypothetical protein
LSLAVACGGGGSSSIPQADACNEAAMTACAKVYLCGSAFQAQLTTAFGTQAQCQSMVVASCGSTGFMCSATETYHGDQATMCRDQFSALSCDTLTAAVLPIFLGSGGTLSSAFATIAAMIPPCNQICTATP